MQQPDLTDICVITGVGPGTGSALVRKFAERYHVAMIARSGENMQALCDELPNVSAFSCDVSDEAMLAATVEAINALGDVHIVIHNAVRGGMGDVLEIEPRALRRSFEINTMALLHLVQAFAPAMVERGAGAILATGNTSAYRGRANFVSFAPTKAAQRILLESAARRLGPDGVHVAYVAIDAAIDVPWTRAAMPDKPDDFFTAPADIAAECFHIAHQPRSAWVFDVMIRPHGETW
ncbi:MAG: SDR family NAD(P)-dependent oxidoreductase [Halioglobus sp.]|nr:SDR family NAD(P)-dependent oxidoreductase [Halioglobus sp.]